VNVTPKVKSHSVMYGLANLVYIFLRVKCTQEGWSDGRVEKAA
jgi:hypothetical protein